MSSRTYIYYGFGIRNVYASDEELCKFIREHEETYIELHKSEIPEYVQSGGKHPSVEFAYCTDDSSCEETELSLITNVIQKETGVCIEYRSGDDGNMIAFLETYPWNYRTEEIFLTKEALAKIFDKYLSGFKCYKMPDYIEVQCYG